MTAAKHWGKGDVAAKKTRSLLSYGTKYPEVETIPNPYYAGREVTDCMCCVYPDVLCSGFGMVIEQQDCRTSLWVIGRICFRVYRLRKSRFFFWRTPDRRLS